MARCRTESGAATVVVLGLAMSLVAVAFGAGTVVAAVVAHRAAQNAADLAALAGAQQAVRAGDGCSQARSLAQENGARLTSCSVDGSTVVVEVAVATRFGARAEMRARARAGPAPDQVR